MYIKSSFLLNQKGQTLLIIVLIMVIALTVGLSVATRTIVNLRTTSEQTSSQKALTAAETGIEEALSTGSVQSIPKTITSGSGINATYQTESSTVGNTSLPFLLNLGKAVNQHDPIYVWVVPYSQDFASGWNGSLTLYWGQSGTNCNTYDSANPGSYVPTPALEVTVVYGTKEAPNVKRIPIDPCDGSGGSPNRAATSHISNPVINRTTTHVCTGDACADLIYNATLDLSSGVIPQVLLVRVNPIYNSTPIGAAGNPALAGQGNLITSVGKTSDGNVVIKITVFQGYPEIPPEFFPFTLFQP